jgi:hypothetical protein
MRDVICFAGLLALIKNIEERPSYSFNMYGPFEFSDRGLCSKGDYHVMRLWLDPKINFEPLRQRAVS